MKRLALTLALSAAATDYAFAQATVDPDEAARVRAPEAQAPEHHHAAQAETAMPEASAAPDAHAHHAMAADAHARQPRTPIAPITDADRVVAFAPVHAHAMEDDAIHAFMLVDRFERRESDRGFAWEGQGWIGTDIDRVRWRTQGERAGGHAEHADAELLYSRMVSPWWDVVGGMRHDFAPGGAQDFAALGVTGLAPYKFELAATLYLGRHGQSAARFEVEYELPLSQRWVLQPRLEANAYGKADVRRDLGAGLNDIEAGLRLRWEIRREFAPYVGLERRWRFGDAGRFMHTQGNEADDWRWVAGVRFWL